MIYADNNATTRCLPEVAAAMQDCLDVNYANPSSRHYSLGRAAAGILDQARAAAATYISARSDELIFCSGATEALNQVILGVYSRLHKERPVICIAATEHPAVLEAAQHCRRHGAELRVVPVDASGVITLEAISEAVDERCCLLVSMLANNETGVINDIASFAALAGSKGCLLLCDATAALSKIPVDVRGLACDFLVASAHKIHGPKGCGLLYKKRGLSIDPLIYGGGQEQELRSGTENLPAIAGFAAAIHWHQQHAEAHRSKLQDLQSQLETQLQAAIDDLRIHGSDVTRVPGCSMLTVPGMEKGWLAQLKSVAASSGSSCSSGTGKTSHVLKAMNLDDKDAANSIRISFGHFNDIDEVETIARELIKGAEKLQHEKKGFR